MVEFQPETRLSASHPDDTDADCIKRPSVRRRFRALHPQPRRHSSVSWQACFCSQDMWTRNQPKREQSDVSAVSYDILNLPGSHNWRREAIISENFLCLGADKPFDGIPGDEIAQCISKSSAAFGHLKDYLWELKSQNIKLYDLKDQCLRSCSAIQALYKTWAPYRKHTRRIEAFYMRCLKIRRICNICWQDCKPDTTFLEMCSAVSIELILVNSQLPWSET